uniref:HIT domain-containing protein n=1 Tax=Anopheles christyi TaxID=43041 RepID=A0A182JR19_9DIPT
MANSEEETAQLIRDHWSYQLVREMEDESLHLKSTSKSVAIRDLYPKALYHFLVMPRKDINTLHELTIDDVGLLEDMYRLAHGVIKEWGLDKKQFNFGYHLKPHMKRLHLHVISKDFDSPGLKRRHHWTIFNTDIFQSHEAVLTELKMHGQIHQRPDAYIEALRKGPLKCTVCLYERDHLIMMKKHIIVHSTKHHKS